VVCGIGVDLVEVDRITKALERHGDRFLRRIYSAAEMERVHGNREQFLAARFAAKEAAMKALGTGWGGGVRWVDIEVDNLPSGQPVLALAGGALARAQELGVKRQHLTISHTAGHAMAQVVLEG
jgi:holo-[acyl-carrier protein] synthase